MQNTSVVIRMEWIVKDIWLNFDQEPIDFAPNGQDGPKVRLSRYEPGDPSKHHAADCSCVATKTIPMPDELAGAFSALAEGRLPPKSKKKSELEGYPVGPDGEMVPPFVLEAFPSRFQEFAQGVRLELQSAAERIVGAIRWRYAKDGPLDPLKPFNIKWSYDGEMWFYLFDVFKIYTGVGAGLPLLNSSVQELEALASQGGSPVYHDLLYEARELCNQNPRSSIIMAISAAEVAVKQCIETVIPGTAWLLGNVPSPPVLKMLSEQFPLLAESQPQGEFLCPHKLIRTWVATGIETRNRLVHVGRVATSTPVQQHLMSEPSSRKKLIFAIDQLLSIVDFNRGYKWARYCILPDSIIERELGLKSL